MEGPHGENKDPLQHVEHSVQGITHSHQYQHKHVEEAWAECLKAVMLLCNGLCLRQSTMQSSKALYLQSPHQPGRPISNALVTL